MCLYECVLHDMNVCMYACMYVCMYVCMYMFVSFDVCVCVCVSCCCCACSELDGRPVDASDRKAALDSFMMQVRTQFLSACLCGGGQFYNAHELAMLIPGVLILL